MLNIAVKVINKNRDINNQFYFYLVARTVIKNQIYEYYTVYFAIVPPGGKTGAEKKQVLRPENPNDFIAAAQELKFYGYPNPENIRIIRIE